MSQTRYTKDHEYVHVDGDIGIVGISDHAQSQLGDVVFVELPKLGAKLAKGTAAAVVESVKAASDVYTPVSGEVLEVNAAVEAQPGIATRAHLAAAMVAGGHARSIDDVFRKYLGRGKPARIAANWPGITEVVGWIVAAGGVATLAHPARYKLSASGRRQLLAEFAAAGGTALEVVSGGNAAHNIEPCARWAASFGLRGSTGSDFHDPQLSWNPLGRLAKLPDGVTPVWRDRLV